MAENTRLPADARHKALLKAGLFVVFIVVAIGLVRYSPLKHYFTAEALQQFLNAAGLWAPLVFIVVYAAGVCLLSPGPC